MGYRRNQMVPLQQGRFLPKLVSIGVGAATAILVVRYPDEAATCARAIGRGLNTVISGLLTFVQAVS